MVAALQDSARAVMAIHRTYLRADITGKAGVRSPKMALGPMGDGAVRLAHAGDALGLCVVMIAGQPPASAAPAAR